MNKYEAIFIARPDLDEAAIQATMSKTEALVKREGGTVTRMENWGKRRLAYEVKDFKEGYYVWMNFELPQNAIPRMENFFRLAEDIIRDLIVIDEGKSQLVEKPPETTGVPFRRERWDVDEDDIIGPRRRGYDRDTEME